mmetsp:Transcript_69987/g.198355  ORF Transcript_69987/g.198355 Transcript_69987/m.198355 type:complete len:523 (-) Transcript_69987:392-1960(-)
MLTCTYGRCQNLFRVSEPDRRPWVPLVGIALCSRHNDGILPLPLLGSATEDVPAEAPGRGQHARPDDVAVHPAAFRGVLAHGGLVAHPPASVLRDIQEELLVDLVLEDRRLTALPVCLEQVVQAVEAGARHPLNLNDLDLLHVFTCSLPIFLHHLSAHDADHGVHLPRLVLQLEPPANFVWQRTRWNHVAAHEATCSSFVLGYGIRQPPAPIHGQVQPYIWVSLGLVRGRLSKVVQVGVVLPVESFQTPDLHRPRVPACPCPQVAGTRCSRCQGHPEGPALLPDLGDPHVPPSRLGRMHARLHRGTVHDASVIPGLLVLGTANPPALIARKKQPEVRPLLMLEGWRFPSTAIRRHKVIKTVNKGIHNPVDADHWSLESGEAQALPLHGDALGQPEAGRGLWLPFTGIRLLPCLNLVRESAGLHGLAAEPAALQARGLGLGIAEPPAPTRGHKEPLAGLAALAYVRWRPLFSWVQDVPVDSVYPVQVATPELNGRCRLCDGMRPLPLHGRCGARGGVRRRCDS